MIVFDDKDNIALETTRIGTSYLANTPASKKILSPLSILLFEKVELKWYDTDNKISQSLQIWSASTNFLRSNGSNKDIVDNDDNNITMDTPLKNAFIGDFFSFSSCSQ